MSELRLSDNGLSLPRQRAPKVVGGVKLGRATTAEGRKLAAAILEVLAGARTPAQAAEALGVSLPRYYQIEQRALEGLLQSCEPRAKGRQKRPEDQAARLQGENDRLQRELTRQQALVRMAQRSVGLPPPVTPAKKPGKRQRKPLRRALALATRLRKENSDIQVSLATEALTTK
jgi:hypothetical protein